MISSHMRKLASIKSQSSFSLSKWLLNVWLSIPHPTKPLFRCTLNKAKMTNPSKSIDPAGSPSYFSKTQSSLSPWSSMRTWRWEHPGYLSCGRLCINWGRFVGRRPMRNLSSVAKPTNLTVDYLMLHARSTYNCPGIICTVRRMWVSRCASCASNSNPSSGRPTINKSSCDTNTNTFIS